MSEAFIGDIRLFAGNFAPRDWAFCDGSVLPIDQFEALFALIGTTYGGDGSSTFALPDLRGRVPVHQGQAGGLDPTVTGQAWGSEAVTLAPAQMPAHQHTLQATSAAANPAAGPNGMLATATVAMYGTDLAPNIAMASGVIGAAGGSQPHNNMAPSLGLNFIIALFGIFPPRS